MLSVNTFFSLVPPEAVEANSSETTTLRVGDKVNRHFPLWRRWNNLNVELHKELFVENMSWDADNKGLVIRNIQKKDEGEYEVSCNHLIQRFTIYVKASAIEGMYAILGDHMRIVYVQSSMHICAA